MGLPMGMPTGQAGRRAGPGRPKRDDAALPPEITQVLRTSVDLYRRLEAETGLATGWRQTGCLRLACSAERISAVFVAGAKPSRRAELSIPLI